MSHVLYQVLLETNCYTAIAFKGRTFQTKSEAVQTLKCIKRHCLKDFFYTLEFLNAFYAHSMSFTVIPVFPSTGISAEFFDNISDFQSLDKLEITLHGVELFLYQEQED